MTTNAHKAAKRIMLSGRRGVKTLIQSFVVSILFSAESAVSTSSHAYYSHRHFSMTLDNYTPREVCNNNTAGGK